MLRKLLHRGVNIHTLNKVLLTSLFCFFSYNIYIYIPLYIPNTIRRTRSPSISAEITILCLL